MWQRPDMKHNWQYLAKKKVLYHQDNTRVHTCVVAIQNILRITHPDIFSIFNIIEMARRRFGTNEEVSPQTDATLGSGQRVREMLDEASGRTLRLEINE